MEKDLPGLEEVPSQVEDKDKRHRKTWTKQTKLAHKNDDHAACRTQRSTRHHSHMVFIPQIRTSSHTTRPQRSPIDHHRRLARVASISRSQLARARVWVCPQDLFVLPSYI